MAAANPQPLQARPFQEHVQVPSMMADDDGEYEDGGGGGGGGDVMDDVEEAHMTSVSVANHGAPVARLHIKPPSFSLTNSGSLNLGLLTLRDLHSFIDITIKCCNMDGSYSFWQLGDELRGQTKVSEDHKWLWAASKLAEQTRSKGERMNNLDFSKSTLDARPREKFGFQEDNKFESFNFNMLSLDSKMTDPVNKSSLRNGIYNMNAVYVKNNTNVAGNLPGAKFSGNDYINKDLTNYSSTNNNVGENANSINAIDKRFKTLPATETLPRNEVLGGYIFVCNNDTMQEDLKRQLFGLPPRYRDSVRAITPGLPLFLYNYTTHQLHGIFEAASFGGSNIDPTAWEDKKCKGESRFPAQVRIRIRKLCRALEEDSFRPVLHHYDGPKFRLELSIPETLDLLDLCEQAGSAS